MSVDGVYGQRGQKITNYGTHAEKLYTPLKDFSFEERLFFCIILNKINFFGVTADDWPPEYAKIVATHYLLNDLDAFIDSTLMSPLQYSNLGGALITIVTAKHRKVPANEFKVANSYPLR